MKITTLHKGLGKFDKCTSYLISDLKNFDIKQIALSGQAFRFRDFPVDPTKTCKEYGSQRLWYERQKDDELATLSRNILSAKSMLAKRNSDIPDYKMFYDFFRKERIRWKKAVESGEKSREEYREWLLFMKNCKTFKEAGIIPSESNR